MSEQTPLGEGGSFCQIVGCTSPGTTTRWIMTEKDGRRQIEVCWKHAEGELTEADLDPESSE